MKQNLPVEHPAEKRRAEAAGVGGLFDAARCFPVGAGDAIPHGWHPGHDELLLSSWQMQWGNQNSQESKVSEVYQGATSHLGSPDHQKGQRITFLAKSLLGYLLYPTPSPRSNVFKNSGSNDEDSFYCRNDYLHGAVTGNKKKNIFSFSWK